ncbi:unnamed protein product [Sphenostylis stenocarpa]|uniref:Uncharacterized protein n=1 Tax=Sphenostylis stenocarpa TaxID=92480 RepID=A0AA86S079_9FABA|nr:unnamed protein product [Sphenostylis stenocarpa]
MADTGKLVDLIEISQFSALLSFRFTFFAVFLLGVSFEIHIVSSAPFMLLLDTFNSHGSATANRQLRLHGRRTNKALPMSPENASGIVDAEVPMD